MTWQPEKLTGAQRAERRRVGGEMLQSGRYTQAAIARELGVSEASVSKWKRALDAQGPQALDAQPISGRPAKLSSAQHRKLERILKRGARKAGFETERWTQWRIQQVIEREFEVHYHPNYISALMRQLGWSVQLPSKRLVERDEDLIRAWLSRDWSRIKKAQRLGATILFEDEFAMAFAEPLARTWAPLGQTPRLAQVGYFRRALSTLAGLTTGGQLLKLHFTGAITGREIVRGLKHFQRHVPGALIIIWDRARSHLAGVVKQYLAAHPEIQVEVLPTYAPELNPEEYCHGNIKQRLRNLAPTTVADIRRGLDRGFARIRRRPDLMLGFIHHAGLSLNQLT